MVIKIQFLLCSKHTACPSWRPAS